MSDFGSTGGDVYLVDTQSGASRNLTAEAPLSVAVAALERRDDLDVVAPYPAPCSCSLDASSGAFPR